MSSVAATTRLPMLSSRRAAIVAFFDPPRTVIALIIFGTIMRIAMAAAFGLGSDESYTVANARTLALSYVDYPPLHAWIVGLWAWVCGSEAPWIVRLPFIALFAGSTWMMYRLSVMLFGIRAGVWAAVLFNLAPVFTLPHASWVLPDGPLIFFMLWCARVTARILFADSEPSGKIESWMLAGALAGLAMLSKYHGIFLLAGVFVFLLSWKPGRRVLATPGPWIGALVALAVFSPVIVWNAQHDWAGLLFQTQRLTDTHLEFGRMFGSIGAQAGYLAPWIFAPLAYVWIVTLKRGPDTPRRWFLAMLASGPIILFTLATIFAPGLPHWPMPGWLFMFPVLGAEAAVLAQKRLRLMFGAVAASTIALMAVIALFGTDARSGWLAGEAPARYTHVDPTIDLLDWNALGPILARRHLMNAQTPAIAATQWKEAGKLNYAMGRKVPVLCLCANPQQFRYSQTLTNFAGRDIIVVGAHRDASDIDSALAGMFARVETLAPIVLTREGRPAIELTVVRGFDFRPGHGARP